MAINDLPILSALRTKMQWHQERQKLLAENVANADTPGFQPKDLRAPSFTASGGATSAGVAVERTNGAHLALGQCIYWFDNDYDRAVTQFESASRLLLPHPHALFVGSVSGVS